MNEMKSDMVKEMGGGQPPESLATDKALSETDCRAGDHKADGKQQKRRRNDCRNNRADLSPHERGDSLYTAEIATRRRRRKSGKNKSG